MWDTSQLRKMMKGLNRCSAAKRKEPRSAVWCPWWLGRIGGGTHSAQGYGMLLLWVKICQKKNNHTDKIDLAKNIPITALIPYILGDLLVISMCSPVWALCLYPFSIWELQAADIGRRCSSLCLTFSDDWRGERCLRLFVDALRGIWWNPAISIQNKQRTWTGHASENRFGLPWDADIITPRVSIGSWFFRGLPNKIATSQRLGHKWWLLAMEGERQRERETSDDQQENHRKNGCLLQE